MTNKKQVFSQGMQPKDQVQRVPPVKCQWCDKRHEGTCPLIKEIEYQPDGVTIKRVVFFKQEEA